MRIDDTMILDLENGSVRAIQSSALAGANVAIRVDGQPERVVEVRPVLADEIEHYLRDYHSCELAGEWHRFGDAIGVAIAALSTAGESGNDLAARLSVPIEALRKGNPTPLLAEFRALRPARQVVRQTLSDALKALDLLDKVEIQAARVEDSAKSAAPSPDRQQLRFGDAEINLG